MNLDEILRSRGYAFRRHLEEVGWTQRQPTVVDLTEAQREALARDGLAGLRRVLAEDGSYTFPALEITEPLPLRRQVQLRSAAVVAPAPGDPLRQLADRFVAGVAARVGVTLPVLDADATGWEILQERDVVLFGGAHDNACSLAMALRYQTLYLDATLPGDGGWAVTTLTGLDPAGTVAVQLTASPEHLDAALDKLLAAVTVIDGAAVVDHVHTIVPGALMRAHFPNWDQFTGAMPSRLPQLKEQPVEAPQDVEALADLLAIGLDSGGKEVNHYNVAPLDIAVTCAQYFLRSAEPRALELFRALLFRMADYYLKTPGGASYPADLDFRLGHLILYFARLESEPAFSVEDRLILGNLLLACSRSVLDYNIRHWPVEADGRTRHNHQTFAGRSLLYAADYFMRYAMNGSNGLAERFRLRADAIFSGGMFSRFKQKENANHYEHYAYEHGSSYGAFTGQGLDIFRAGILRRTAERTLIVCDNFFRGVDYGDASVSMAPSSDDAVAVLATCAQAQPDPVLEWFTGELFQRSPRYIPGHGSIPGIRRTRGGGEVRPLTGGWELLPLDPEFMADYAPDFPRLYAFDKLAFRTGWEPDDHYLLFEGVGGASISHAHLEVNGIVRLNHLGRHWLVSNGYGRQAGLTNVAESFSSRVRGPEDHNTLVPTQGGQILRTQPMCAALLQHGANNDVLYATGALLDYSGLDWYRTLVVLAGRFVLVIDRLSGGDGEADGGHIEWQALGELAAQEGGFVLAQQGVYLHLLSSGGWPVETGVADRSADWKRVLDSGAYPYASFPLRKVMCRLPLTDAPMRLCTLLAATRHPDPTHAVSTAADTVRVEGDCGGPELTITDGDLTIRRTRDVLQVECAGVPYLPPELRRLAR